MKLYQFKYTSKKGPHTSKKSLLWLVLMIIIILKSKMQYMYTYMYSLNSITCVSLTDVDKSLTPPNTIIQLVVGVTFHTERECRHLSITVSGILPYIILNLCDRKFINTYQLLPSSFINIK